MATRKLRERDVEAYLVKRVKARGGEVRKVKWIGRNSAPDRVVMFLSTDISPTDANLVWVELKAPGEKPTAAQLREHERMRKMRQLVLVIDSFEGVDELCGGAQ